jgi:hypothetical protein
MIFSMMFSTAHKSLPAVRVEEKRGALRAFEFGRRREHDESEPLGFRQARSTGGFTAARAVLRLAALSIQGISYQAATKCRVDNALRSFPPTLTANRGTPIPVYDQNMGRGRGSAAARR